MQSWKKSGLAALLLIILLAGVLFASEPEDEVLLELPEQRAETEEKRPAHQSIAGSEQAAVSKGLKDPFTLLHETREEKGKAAEKKTAVQAAEQEKRPAPPISPFCRASVRALVSTIPPLAILTRNASFFIFPKAASSNI